MKYTLMKCDVFFRVLCDMKSVWWKVTKTAANYLRHCCVRKITFLIQACSC